MDKEVETCSMKGGTVVVHRLVCDYVTQHRGVTKASLTKELDFCDISQVQVPCPTRSEEKKESDVQGKKREALEDHLEELKKKRKTVPRGF